MKRTSTIVLLIMLLYISSLVAQDKNFGLGIILGEPTGLSGKQWIGETTAIDGSLAWSFGKKDALHIHADFLVHHYNLLKVTKGKLPIYYGIGGRIKLEEDSKIGVRIPVGLDYQIEDAPLDIFIELVPLLELIPGTEFGMNGAIGVRFFF
jgi:hypothetical protein